MQRSLSTFTASGSVLLFTFVVIELCKARRGQAALQAGAILARQGLTGKLLRQQSSLLAMTGVSSSLLSWRSRR